jgi:cell wall-associated NlpC family hydrolase
LGAAGDLASNIHTAGPVRKGAGGAVAAAASQIGKPYRWGGAGPDSYDCSGLTMWAWARAGVSLPHSSKAQYASLPHVSLSQLAPGDLIFYGRPIHHVGIYKGGGVMIAAPRSGQTVREESIYYSRPVGAARP